MGSDLPIHHTPPSYPLPPTPEQKTSNTQDKNINELSQKVISNDKQDPTFKSYHGEDITVLDEFTAAENFDNFVNDLIGPREEDSSSSDSNGSDTSSSLGDAPVTTTSGNDISELGTNSADQGKGEHSSAATTSATTAKSKTLSKIIGEAVVQRIKKRTGDLNITSFLHNSGAVVSSLKTRFTFNRTHPKTAEHVAPTKTHPKGPVPPTPIQQIANLNEMTKSLKVGQKLTYNSETRQFQVEPKKSSLRAVKSKVGVTQDSETIKKLVSLGKEAIANAHKTKNTEAAHQLTETLTRLATTDWGSKLLQNTELNGTYHVMQKYLFEGAESRLNDLKEQANAADRNQYPALLKALHEELSVQKSAFPSDSSILKDLEGQVNVIQNIIVGARNRMTQTDIIEYLIGTYDDPEFTQNLVAYLPTLLEPDQLSAVLVEVNKKIPPDFERRILLNKLSDTAATVYATKLQQPDPHNSQLMQPTLLGSAIITIKGTSPVNNPQQAKALDFDGTVTVQDKLDRIRKGSFSRTEMNQVQGKLIQDLRTLHSHYLSAVDPRELMNQAWNKPNKQDIAPNVVNYIALTTATSHQTINSIMQSSNKKELENILKFYIRVGNDCLEDGNFSAAMAIHSALNDASVARLMKNLQLDKETQQMNEHLGNVLNPESSFKNYRHALSESLKSDTHVIPHLGVDLTDLTFIDDGNQAKLPSEDPQSDVIFNGSKLAQNADKMNSLKGIFSKLSKDTPLPLNYSDLLLKTEDEKALKGAWWAKSLTLIPRRETK